MDRKDIELFKRYGIDCNKVLKDLNDVTISIHCWQLDDVAGFESGGNLTGGIQSTGNYPGKARNFKELTEDLDEALKYIPGKNDAEYIKLLEEALNRQRQLTSKAIAK